VVRQQVPYTVNRRAMGCFMSPADAANYRAGKGCGSCGGNAGAIAAAPGAGAPHALNAIPRAHGGGGGSRAFVEGAHCTRDVVYTTTRMVPETHIVRVPYNVTRTVHEQHVKKVPYTVVRMVPHTVTKTVPVTTCHLVAQECVKHVPTKVCTLQ